jgi:hypothetical protein
MQHAGKWTNCTHIPVVTFGVRNKIARYLSPGPSDQMRDTGRQGATAPRTSGFTLRLGGFLTKKDARVIQGVVRHVQVAVPEPS